MMSIRLLLQFCLVLCIASAVPGQNAGNALRFDGDDNSIAIPDSPSLSGGSGKSITVEAWVKLDNLKKDRPVIQKWLDTQWKEWGLIVDGSNEHEVSVAIENNGSNFEYKAGGGVIQPDEWFHIAMTYDWDSRTVRIFINGTEYGPGAVVEQGMPDTRAEIYIGRHAYTATKHFLGNMDEIRIWNFAKTGAELLALMHEPLTGDEQGLLAYWNFDEGAGVVVNDVSGNGHDGLFEQSELDGPQWITSTAPLGDGRFIVLDSPNGGERIEAGSTFTVKWTARNAGPMVMLEFSRDGGSTWQIVEAETDNDGKYGWNVPQEPTSAGMLRITDLSDASLTDVSDALFVIATGPAGDLSFTDITESAGTGGPEAAGETGGHAALFADVNGDGRPDLYHTMLFNQRMADLFFLNLGNNVFSEEAAARGIEDFDGGSHGAVFADLDNDGDFDLFNGTTGRVGDQPRPEHNDIYRNDGAGFFTDMTPGSAIEQRIEPTRGVLAFDMDNDGDLDLLAITNFLGTDDPSSERNELYHNLGNFEFEEIRSGDLFDAPAGQGGTDTDFDNDGDIDIIAGNRTGALNILVNDGHGEFTRINPPSIGINHRGREGVTMGDVNNDGWLDMMLSDFDDDNERAIERLYVSNGDGAFTFRQEFTNTHGFMGGFADLDNDGDLDIVFSGDDRCYLNDGTGVFEQGPDIPITNINDPRAIAFSDIDDDGDLDFAVAAKRSRNWLVRNDLDAGNWLKVDLVAPNGQAGAFGAKVKVYPEGQAGAKLVGYREARSMNGYLGQNDPVLHFGLGFHTSVDVEVQFLDGTKLLFEQVPANQTLKVNLSTVPRISALTPGFGVIGTWVTISGEYLSTAEKVSFGAVEAEFVIESDEEIRTQVPPGAATAPVSITNIAGTGTSQTEFVVLETAVLPAFAPSDDAQVKEQDPEMNYGDKTSFKVEADIFSSFLKFDLSDLQSHVHSATLRMLVLNGSDQGGDIYHVSNHFADSVTPWREMELTFTNAPAIAGQPLDARGTVSVGDTVEFDLTHAIKGPGIYSFALQSNSSDLVEYSSKEGEFAPQVEIVVLPQAPAITSFTPVSGMVGTEVTLNGSGLNSVDGVFFDDTQAPNHVVETDEKIRVVVPPAARSGPIVITSPIGNDTTAASFTVLRMPEIHSVTPVSGQPGTTVFITGRNLGEVTEVLFGEAPAEFEVETDTSLSAIVPAAATTGAITVTSVAGAAVSATDFVVLQSERLVLAPIADAYVKSSGDNLGSGAATELQVSKSDNEQSVSYLKFDVAVLTEDVSNITLRLWVTEGSDDGGALFLAENTYPGTHKPWLEHSLSWETAPRLLTLPLAVLGPLTSERWVEIDVTNIIRDTGTVSFALKNNSADRAKFGSREHRQAPELVVVSVSEAEPEVSNSAGTQATPSDFALYPAYPNPFNAEAIISYAIPEPTRVEVTIYNLRGQIVRRLFDGIETAGVKKVRWNGRDNFDVELASGVYFIRLLAGDRQMVQRITLQK